MSDQFKKTQGPRSLGALFAEASSEPGPKPAPRPCLVCGEPVDPYLSSVFGWVSVQRHDECPFIPASEEAPAPVTLADVQEQMVEAGFFVPEMEAVIEAMQDSEHPLTIPDSLLTFGNDDRYTLHVFGPTHSGKTSRVIAWVGMYLQREQHRKSIVYTTERELVDAVCYDRFSETVPLSSFYEPDVLIIDQCNGRDRRGVDEFCEIIIQRCRRRNLTLTISTSSLDELHQISALWQDAVIKRFELGSKGISVCCQAFTRGGQDG